MFHAYLSYETDLSSLWYLWVKPLRHNLQWFQRYEFAFDEEDFYSEKKHVSRYIYEPHAYVLDCSNVLGRFGSYFFQRLLSICIGSRRHYVKKNQWNCKKLISQFMDLIQAIMRLSRHFSEIKAICLAFDSLIYLTTEHLIFKRKGEKSSKHPFEKI